MHRAIRTRLDRKGSLLLDLTCRVCTHKVKGMGIVDNSALCGHDKAE